MKYVLALLSVFLALPVHAADTRTWQFPGAFLANNYGGTIGKNNFTINSNDDAIAVLTQQPEADTITTVCIDYGTRTGTPPTYRISFQTPSTTALGPDGTVLGGGSPASDTFTPPADASINGLAQCYTLDNTIALTKGQQIAIVVDYSSGTIDGSNNSSFTTSIDNSNGRTFMPITVTKTNGAAWARVDGLPAVWWKSATNVYGWPVETITVGSSTSVDSTPDEWATAFSLPAGSCDTFKVPGMRCVFSAVGNANKSFKFALYSGTTALSDITLDSDTWGAGGDSFRAMEFYFDDDADTLTCGSLYRIAVAPQSTSAGWERVTNTLDAAGDMVAYAGAATLYSSSRTDSGAWSDDTAQIFYCFPIIEDVTEPASGGSAGPKNLNNMKGSMQ